MKFFLCLAALAAVAVAVPTHRGLVTPGAAGAAPIVVPEAGAAPIVGAPIAIGPAHIESVSISDELQEIIAAINSPSTDPATAAALEQILFEALGIVPEPVAVGPAVVDVFEPIAVGPVIVGGIDGIAVGPALVDAIEEPAAADSFEPIAVGPVVVDSTPVAAPSAAAPLVQIILNIQQVAAEATPEAPAGVAPVIVAPVEPQPQPITVVENAPIVPGPVVVATPELPAVPEPVIIGTPQLPIVVEPVVIGTPIIPSPAVILPEELN